MAVAGDTERDIAMREVETEAHKLLPQYATQCGGDHFSKALEYDELRFFRKDRPRMYRIQQYKGLKVKVSLFMASPAEKLNGLAWKALVSFDASVGRSYERLYMEQVGKPPGFQASSGQPNGHHGVTSSPALTSASSGRSMGAS
jgi:hypothetical protein